MSSLSLFLSLSLSLSCTQHNIAKKENNVSIILFGLFLKTNNKASYQTDYVLRFN